MIFILGANGFIGSAFMRVCKARHLPCSGITRQNYQQYLGSSCDLFINANGNSKKYLARQDPLVEFDASVRSVRASLVDFKYSHYIYLSSCDVYPDCSSPQYTNEAAFLDVAKQSPYGFHKGLAEQCVRHEASSWLIFRMGGFVGEGLKKNAIFDILNGGPLWLDPHSTLQFMNVDVAADLMLQIAMENFWKDIFNICGKGLVSLQEAIEYSGKNVLVNPDSPLVKYEVSIQKIEEMITIPDSRDAVFTYISHELGKKK